MKKRRFRLLGHFPDHMWIVPFSVFIAGLLGSGHCISMCGPIVMNFAQSRTAVIAYQLGRLVTYALAGAFVGAFGKALLGPEQSLWVSGLSLFAIASLLFLNAYRLLSHQPMHFSQPILARLQSSVWKRLRHARNVTPNVGGFLAGSLTVLLPCGHLYSFLLGAVATGSAVNGAGFMFAFWLGSTPLLSFGSAWLRQVLAAQGGNARRWGGIFLVAAGIFSLLTFGARSLESYNAQQEIGKPQILRCH